MVELLAVSDRYRTDFLQGHDSSHHVALLQAARRTGHRMSIAALERWTTDEDPLVSLRFPDRDWASIAARLSTALADSPPTVVIVYEGGLDALAALTHVARVDARHTFVVNLFRPEWPLDVPSGSRPRPPNGVWGGALTELENLPSNLVLLADTERRAFLARARGLDIAGVWPPYTSIPVDGPPIEVDTPTSDPRRRILVAVNAWQLKGDPHSAAHIERVLERASSLPTLRFELLGSLPDKRAFRRDLLRGARRLVGAGVGPLDPVRYAERIRSASAVWLPKLGLYATQSSGKAIDVLVAGRPVIAPSGTFADLEQQRWVPGAPSYRDDGELLDLLADIDGTVGGWKRALVEVSGTIRHHYSPESALRILLDFASER